MKTKRMVHHTLGWLRLALLLGLGLGWSWPTAPITAQNTARLRCEGQNSAGLLIVTVSVDNAVALYGVDVRAAFDPKLAEVVDADAAKAGVQILPVGGFLAPDFVVVNTVNNAAGTLQYAVTQLNPRPAVSGSGALARLSFRPRASGSFFLTFTAYQLANRDGVSLPASAVACRLAFDVAAPVTTALLSGQTRTCGPLTCYRRSATVTLTANEPATTTYRLNNGVWQRYSAPVVVNLLGSQRLEFYSTDVAGNVEVAQARTLVITDLSTNVLDAFNRKDGALGSSWSGPDGYTGYRISGQQVRVLDGGPLYWKNGNLAGTRQEAFVSLTTLDKVTTEADIFSAYTGLEGAWSRMADNDGHKHDIRESGRMLGLLLKVQGGNSPDWRKGAIEVLYDPHAKAVRVEVFRPGQSKWAAYPNIPASFQNGDQLAGQASPNGEVRIYRNCVLVGAISLSSADQKFFNGQGGRIGLWFIAAGKTVIDDFGGGTSAP